MVDNTFVGTSGTATGSGTAFTPPYSINKIASQDVKQTVMTGAGAVLLQPTDCVFLSTNEINSKSKSDFLFYPNPASEQIFLKAFSGNSQSIKINVTDISGKSEGTIYQGNLSKGNNTVNSISIKKLSKGVKIFEVKTDKDSYTQKVIVK